MIPTQFIAANPRRRSLLPAEVQLWRLDLQQRPIDCDETVLADSERARLGRLLHPRSRRWRIHCRLTLRYLLGAALGMPAADVPLRVGANGRPQLHAEAARSGINFNVSHAGAIAVVAIADSPQLGVDIERIRSVDLLGVARRMYHPREQKALLALNGAAREQLFFRLWTAKEALLKAEGTGVFHDPAGWRIRTGERLVVAANAVEHRDGSRWSLHEFVPRPGVRGMLALGREDWTIAPLKLQSELTQSREN